MQKPNRIQAIGLQMARAFALLGLIAVSMLSAQAQDPPAQAPADAQAAAPSPSPTPAPAPTALSTPAIAGPLSGLPPFTFDAGPFGKISVNGILSGMGLWQGNHIPGDSNTQAALTNGQVWIQKADGWFQFYLQAGAYNLPTLGTPFLDTDKTVHALYGPLPVAFLKLAPQNGGWKNTSFLIGELPTLIGDETTFTFQNMNIERGLLWNQESAVSRGIQINQGIGKYLSASVSWNDGFYSNRYTWITGSLTFTKGASALSFIGGGNLGLTDYTTAATPLINNSQIFNLIYTFTKGPWVIQPYWQYTNVPTSARLGITKATSADAGAILVSRAFKKGFSLAGRFEYITSSGNASDGSISLLYGPGSNAVTGTLTPTFQYGGFFLRGDLSWVHVSSFTPGFGFGPTGANQNQPRAVAEFGFIFGDNILKK